MSGRSTLAELPVSLSGKTSSERAELYRVLNLVPAMVGITRGPDHVYDFANPFYLKIVGKTDKIIGKSVQQVFPELKGQGILEILDGVYRTGTEFRADEFGMHLDVNNDGVPEPVYFNFVYLPLRDAAGKIEGIISHAVEVSAQVNARKKAQENEARYRMLFDTIDEGFCIVEMIYDESGNAIDYRFIETNKVFENQTGLKSAAGKSIRQLQPNIEEHWIERYGKVAATGESVRFTEGSAAMGRWFDVHASRAGETGSGRVALLFKDITESKQAELQKELATRQVTDVLESMGDAFFMLDKDWNIVRVNKVHEKVTKTKRKEIIGKNFWKVFPDTPDSKYWIEHHKVMKTRRPSHFVEHYAPLDLWTETDVYPTRDGGISVFFRDISASKKAVESLKQSEERFRFMAESLPQLVFTADADGKVEYFNQQWSEYTGVPMERLMSEGVRQFLHPDDLEDNMRSWREALQTGHHQQNQQRLRRADGRYRRFVSNVRGMRGADGKIVRWFGSMTDIEDVLRTASRKKHLETVNTALKEQRAQLIALNAAKDEFISLASHQLRTPATGVKQYLGMALDGFAGELEPSMEKILSRAYESNERQITVINDLLKVAQVDAGKVSLKKQPTQLGRMIREIVADQAAKFTEREQTVETVYPPEDISALVDPPRMRMVLENLIDNASKYTPHGRNIRLGVDKTAGQVVVTIQDQGVGISPEDIDKLFTKFTRLDNPLSAVVGGTGLGLYWAKKIIDLHNGDISVDSVPGESTTFTITLPAG